MIFREPVDSFEDRISLPEAVPADSSEWFSIIWRKCTFGIFSVRKLIYKRFWKYIEKKGGCLGIICCM